MHRHVILRKLGFMMRPVRSSNNVSSVRAMPMPMTIPPLNCDVAVFGFRMRPVSKAPTQRRIRTSPVSSCTAASQNCAAYECIEYFSISNGDPVVTSTSTNVWPARRRISRRIADRRHLFQEQPRPGRLDIAGVGLGQRRAGVFPRQRRPVPSPAWRRPPVLRVPR